MFDESIVREKSHPNSWDLENSVHGWLNRSSANDLDDSHGLTSGSVEKRPLMEGSTRTPRIGLQSPCKASRLNTGPCRLISSEGARIWCALGAS